MSSLRNDIELCLRTHLPYFERDDKDDFLYIATGTQLGHVVEKLAILVEEKLIAERNKRQNLEGLKHTICPECQGADLKVVHTKRCTDCGHLID